MKTFPVRAFLRRLGFMLMISPVLAFRRVVGYQGGAFMTEVTNMIVFGVYIGPIFFIVTPLSDYSLGGWPPRL